MHDVRDPPDDDRTPGQGRSRCPSAPTLVTDDAGTVGFLDAPDAALDQLLVAVLAAFDRLADGAILTVHSHRTDLDAAVDLLRDDHGIAAIAAIPDPRGGSSLTLRQAGPARDDQGL